MEALAFALLVMLREQAPEPESLVRAMMGLILKIDKVESYDNRQEFVEVVVPMMATLTAVRAMLRLDVEQLDPSRAISRMAACLPLHNSIMKEITENLGETGHGARVPAEIVIRTSLSMWERQFARAGMAFPGETAANATEDLLYPYRAPEFAAAMQKLQDDGVFDA